MSELVLNHHVAVRVITEGQPQVKRVYKQVFECGESNGGGKRAAPQLSALSKEEIS